MTANAFTSVSLEPFLILVCVDQRSHLLAAAQAKPIFWRKRIERGSAGILRLFRTVGAKSGGRGKAWRALSLDAGGDSFARRHPGPDRLQGGWQLHRWGSHYFLGGSAVCGSFSRRAVAFLPQPLPPDRSGTLKRWKLTAHSLKKNSLVDFRGAPTTDNGGVPFERGQLTGRRANPSLRRTPRPSGDRSSWPRISHSSGKNLARIPSSRISTGRPLSDFRAEADCAENELHVLEAEFLKQFLEIGYFLGNHNGVAVVVFGIVDLFDRQSMLVQIIRFKRIPNGLVHLQEHAKTRRLLPAAVAQLLLRISW